MDAAQELAKLPNLGPLSVEWLLAAGIHNGEQLRQMGAIRSFLRIKANAKKNLHPQPSLNLLYALQGAIEKCHWQKVAREQRERLLMELEALMEIE